MRARFIFFEFVAFAIISRVACIFFLLQVFCYTCVNLWLLVTTPILRELANYMFYNFVPANLKRPVAYLEFQDKHIE